MVRACLERIAERESVVGAWAYIDPERALASARACDRGPQRGVLHGMPVAIKDIMDTADMPTAYGSPIYAGHRPDADAACVSILRAAGAIVLGKTVTTEFATIFAGKTRNPIDPARTPGGSSSGSAAAVADGMVRVALGTQTMGSVIRPAAYCGVVGFKPSFGLVNRAGIKPQAESIDTVGVFGRSVDDVALVGAVLAGARAATFETRASRPPKVTVYRGPDWSVVEPAAEAALDDTVGRLRGAGALVAEMPSAPIVTAALAAHASIVAYELARALAFEWNNHREQLSAVLGELIETGLNTPFEAYLEAHALAARAREWIALAFDSTDCLITVSAPGEAPKGFATGDPVLNRVWSLLHLPVVTIPVGRGPQNMPLGIQAIGAYRHDAALLRTARWIEQTLAGPHEARPLA